MQENNLIEINEPIESDAEDIQKVFYETWLATYPNEEAGITRDDIEDRFKDAFSETELQRVRERILQPRTNEKFLVARDSGTVIGVCRVIRDEDSNQLQAIYILPKHQSKGIGKRLWDEGNKFLDMSKVTNVEVAEYNQNAIDFYKRLGFVDTGERFHNERFRMKSGATLPEMRMQLEPAESD